MTSELQSAIRGLYSAFRRRGRASVPQGCPCCTTPLEFEHLVARPLEHLSATDLDRYTRKAMTTVGHTENFRYFLPRIVELAVQDEFLVDREVIFGKLRYGKWQEWALYEREAIERFAEALSASFATSEYDVWELDTWVCALGQFVDDLPRYLQPMLSQTTVAKANLRALLNHNEEALWQGELSNAFWQPDNRNTSVFLEWLRRPDVHDAAA